MEYRSEQLLSQEGMTASLTRFAHLMSTGLGLAGNTLETPAFNAKMPPVFVRCSFEQNTLVYRYEVEPWMANPGGAIHGGMAATMLDTTMGALSYYMAGEKLTPTITMKVDYVAPGLMHLPVYVGCKCTRCGGTMAYITCKAWQADEEKPFATADGVYYTAGPKADLSHIP